MAFSSRRSFLAQGFAATATSLVSTPVLKAAETTPKKQWPVILFEKPVQSLSYDVIGEKVAEMGANGIEATIRQGGHFDVDVAAVKVPQMMKALAKHGVAEVVAATHITEANNKTGDFLKILKEHGIGHVRIQHLRYQKKRDPMEQIPEINDRLKRLEEMFQRHEIQGLYQVHSGWRIAGSLGWDVALMMKGIDADILGIALDPRHVRTDCGSSWQVATEIIKPHTRAIYVKDARWGGQRSDQLINTPLDTGFVNQKMFDFVREGLPVMPISLHMEWGEHQIYPKEQVEKAWSLIERDMKTLLSWVR